MGYTERDVPLEKQRLILSVTIRPKESHGREGAEGARTAGG